MIEKIEEIKPDMIVDVPVDTDAPIELADVIERLDALEVRFEELLAKNNEVIDYANQVELYLGEFGK